LDTSFFQAERPADRAQQGRFAATVRSEDRGDLRGWQRQRQLSKQPVFRSEPMACILYADHAALLRVLRRSSRAKMGVPTIAVIMPTGISARVNDRASVSATTRKMAPRRAETGRIRRLSAPTIIRARFGMMRPTQPIVPLTAT